MFPVKETILAALGNTVRVCCDFSQSDAQYWHWPADMQRRYRRACSIHNTNTNVDHVLVKCSVNVFNVPLECQIFLNIM